jgi:PHD/YefM family antitoxin component YafN of YafNO toxin-antitoxin module
MTPSLGNNSRNIVQFILYISKRNRTTGWALMKKVVRLGKAQAREQFAPLVESLTKSGGIIEITDYGRVAAVMLSYPEYLMLKSQAQHWSKPERQLAGSAELIGELDDEEEDGVHSIIGKALLRRMDKT